MCKVTVTVPVAGTATAGGGVTDVVPAVAPEGVYTQATVPATAGFEDPGCPGVDVEQAARANVATSVDTRSTRLRPVMNHLLARLFLW